MKKQILIFLLAIAITGTSFGQKTTHGNCRFSVQAVYSHGIVQVKVTNATDDCHTTYTVQFGHEVAQTPIVYPGKSGYINFYTLSGHGTVIVTVNNFYPANCPMEPGIVNL